VQCNDVVVCRNGSGRGDESFSTSFFYGQSFDVGKSDFPDIDVVPRWCGELILLVFSFLPLAEECNRGVEGINTANLMNDRSKD